jgi:uncharacterized protein YjiS (DUF1127 family)
MDLLQNIYLAWRQYREFHANLNRLQRLPERELARIGAARSDLTRLAYEESERSVDELVRERLTTPGTGHGGLAASAGRRVL